MKLKNVSDNEKNNIQLIWDKLERDYNSFVSDEGVSENEILQIFLSFSVMKGISRGVGKHTLLYYISQTCEINDKESDKNEELLKKCVEIKLK